MTPLSRVSPFLAVLAFVIAAARPAAGDDVPVQNRALARSLFEQGRQLMADKKYDEACPKLAESERLDPAAGTRINLATCNEAIGKTATAWSEFNDALTEARRENRSERVDYAQKHIAALEPQLSRLTVIVAPGAAVDGLEVKLDGVALGRASWGVAAPVDPGPHALVATAPHHTQWTGGVTLGPKADQKTIVVPSLAEAPESVVALPPAASSTTASPPPAADDAGGGHGRRTTAFVVGGVGIAALAVGTVFGVSALSSWSDRNAHCGASGCDAQGVSSGNSASTSAWIADIGIGAGVVALGVGAYLLLSAPHADDRPSASRRPSSRQQALTIRPDAGPHSAGFTIGGAW